MYHLIFRVYFILWKQAKGGFTNFSFSRTGMWASFPDVLNLIFVVFNFANGHRPAKYAKLAKHKTYTVCISSVLKSRSVADNVVCTCSPGGDGQDHVQPLYC